MSYDSAIAALSIDALKFVKDNSIVGLGSGRAATALVNSLASLIKIKKYKILGIPTSLQIKLIAEQGGIPIVEADQVDHIDVVFDGADQIDSQNFVIKGGGGALLRENINTPSYDQVTQPIYSSSINRYKNFDKIKNLKNEIDYWIKKFSY